MDCTVEKCARALIVEDDVVAITFPEPTCLLVSTKTRSLTKRHVGSGNEIDVVYVCFVVLAAGCFVYDERAMCGFVCLNDWVFLGRKGN